MIGSWWKWIDLHSSFLDSFGRCAGLMVRDAGTQSTLSATRATLHHHHNRCRHRIMRIDVDFPPFFASRSPGAALLLRHRKETPLFPDLIKRLNTLQQQRQIVIRLLATFTLAPFLLSRAEVFSSAPRLLHPDCDGSTHNSLAAANGTKVYVDGIAPVSCSTEATTSLAR